MTSNLINLFSIALMTSYTEITFSLVKNIKFMQINFSLTITWDMTDKSPVHSTIFDQILSEKLGDFGLFQKALIFLLAIPACCLTAYGTSDLVFLAYTPKFTCSEKLNFSTISISTIYNESRLQKCIYYDENGTKTTCKNWNYDKTYFTETLTTKWNLVCDQAVVIRSMVGE